MPYLGKGDLKIKPTPVAKEPKASEPQLPHRYKSHVIEPGPNQTITARGTQAKSKAT